MVVVQKGDRTPEYFGAVSRSCRERPSMNPYFGGNMDEKADPRHKQWIKGYERGQIAQLKEYPHGKS